MRELCGGKGIVMFKPKQFLSNLKYIMKIMLETAALFLVLTLLFSLFSGLGNVAQAYFLSKIIDGILAAAPFRLVALYAAGIIAFQLFARLQTRTLFALNRVVTEEIGVRMESGILDRVEHIPLSRMDDPGFLNRMEQARNLTKRTPNSVFMILFGAVGLIAGTLGYIGILSRISILYVVILIACSVLVFVANNRYEENVMASLFAMSPQRRKMGYFSDLLTKRDSFEEIRAYQAAGYLRDRYRESARQQIDAFWGIFRRYTGFYGLAALVSYGGCGLVYLLIIRRAIGGEISVGDLAMFLTACLSFQAGLTELFDGLCSLPPQLNMLQGYRNFMEELDRAAEAEKDGSVGGKAYAAGVEEADNAPCAVGPGRELVRAEGLTFAYPGTGRRVLNQVTFRIRSGECVALVGTNGSGKTTLARLLAGFYDHYEGRLTIGGREAGGAGNGEVAVMFQNYLKPSLTVGEAVALGPVTAQNEAGIRQALERSGYAQGEQGLSANLTKAFDGNGLMPSGGQWQKLALARLLYRDAGMYILDEPSASLDPQAEDEVFRMLAEMKGEKAVLFITHRLASVSIADWVLYLTPEGEMVQGTHAELMAGCIAYRELYETQAKKYRTGGESDVGDSAV